MGRGRARAKQTKVARDLKYRPVDTDFASLERELRGEYYEDVEDNDDPPDDVPEAYADFAEEYGSPGRNTDDDEDGHEK